MIRRTLLGYQVLGQKYPIFRVCPLPVLILGVWAIGFGVFFPIIWHTGWAVNEALLVGDLSPTYPPSDKCAYVTLVTNKNYVRGARVLAHTLALHSLHACELVALEAGLGAEERARLAQVGWRVKTVEAIPFRPVNAGPEWTWVPERRLGDMHVHALTKMRAWELEEYQRIVFIDADAWCVGDVADLTRRTEDLAAAGDMRVDINSGIMSLRPNKVRFQQMMDFWTREPQKLFVYAKRGRLPNELVNPDQSLILGFHLAHNLPIGPMSGRYNYNGRRPPDSQTRIVHFNVDVVKPWSVTRQEAQAHYERCVREGDAAEAGVWSNVLEFLNLETLVDQVYQPLPKMPIIEQT